MANIGAGASTHATQMHRPSEWEAGAADRVKSRATRQRLWNVQNDTKAKLKARQRLFRQRMTPEKATLWKAIERRRYTATQISRAQSTGKKFEPRISLAYLLCG